MSFLVAVVGLRVGVWEWAGCGTFFILTPKREISSPDTGPEYSGPALLLPDSFPCSLALAHVTSRVAFRLLRFIWNVVHLLLSWGPLPSRASSSVLIIVFHDCPGIKMTIIQDGFGFKYSLFLCPFSFSDFKRKKNENIFVVHPRYHGFWTQPYS